MSPFILFIFFIYSLHLKGGGGGDGGDGGGGGKFRSVGCFKDNPNDRAFDFGPWTDNAMTVSKCVAFCRGKSYQVAGLQVS